MQQQQGEQAEEYYPRNGAPLRLLLEQHSTDDGPGQDQRESADERIVGNHVEGGGQVRCHWRFDCRSLAMVVRPTVGRSEMMGPARQSQKDRLSLERDSL